MPRPRHEVEHDKIVFAHEVLDEKSDGRWLRGFALAGFSDAEFCVDRTRSFVDDHGQVNIIVQRRFSADEARKYGLREGWNDFTRTTVVELVREWRWL